MVPYGQSLTLLTDLFYQLTMSAAAWKAGADQREGAFHLFFRGAPFGSGFTVAAGLSTALEYLRGWGLDQHPRQQRAGRADVGDGVSSQTLVDPIDVTKRQTLPPGTPWEDLLVPVWRGGAPVYQSPVLHERRTRMILAARPA
jgi:nicotinic acid phosphoribosyltransferase